MTRNGEVRSYFDPELRVSIELPAGWDVASSDDFPLLLLAPLDHGFRANVGFYERSLEPATVAGFVATIEQMKAEHERDFDAYEMVGERRAVQDGRPAHLVRCRWDHDDPAVRLSQVSALYAEREDRLVVVYCTALAEREGEYLPQFQRILDSLRFIDLDG